MSLPEPLLFVAFGCRQETARNWMARRGAEGSMDAQCPRMPRGGDGRWLLESSWKGSRWEHEFLQGLVPSSGAGVVGCVAVLKRIAPLVVDESAGHGDRAGCLGPLLPGGCAWLPGYRGASSRCAMTRGHTIPVRSEPASKAFLTVGETTTCLR